MQYFPEAYLSDFCRKEQIMDPKNLSNICLNKKAGVQFQLFLVFVALEMLGFFYFQKWQQELCSEILFCISQS